MQFLLEAIYRCNAAAEITFATLLAAKGVKVVLAMHALFYAADSLFSCLRHDVILAELTDLTSVSLEMGAT